MNESQINENKLEENESVVDNNSSNIGMKVFAFILLIIMFLSIVFGLLLFLDGLYSVSDGCDDGKGRGVFIENSASNTVKLEYQEKGNDFCEEFTSSEDILNYIKSGQYDTVSTPENYSYFAKDMVDFENYLIRHTGRNDTFMYNTIFIQIEGLYTPLVHFTEDNIYFDIETFKKGEDREINKVLQTWVDCLDDLGFAESEIVDCISEIEDNVSNTIYEHFIVLFFDSVKKPVIYLYPEKVTELNITLETENIDLTTTYPDYKDGWDVMVYPDGTIVDKNNRKYSYLYWEGNSKVPFIDMSKGFVVSKDNYIEFLECKLSEIGLTDKEACDFITYWLPQMNEYEYCLASFQMENYEDQVKLDYSVNPDNELRLFVAFKGLDRLIDIEEQDLSYYEDFEREGFVVVEWGGTFVDEE